MLTINLMTASPRRSDGGNEGVNCNGSNVMMMMMMVVVVVAHVCVKTRKTRPAECLPH